MTTIDPAVREDLRKAWRTARRFLRLQREHPLWLRRQAVADRLLALEWVLLIAVTYLLVFGPLPWPLKLVLLAPWSLYSSLALDVAVRDGRIKRGDLVLMEAMGGGFTWGAVLVRW